MGVHEDNRALRAQSRAVSAVFAWIAVALFVCGVVLWLSEAAGANAQGASAVIATGPVESPSARRHVSFSGPHDEFGEPEPEWVAELPRMLTTHEEDIEAGQYLELIALVREVDGSPVRKAAVLFEWQTGHGRYLVRETTDFRGVASMRRWIGERERGAAHKVRVSVDTPTWNSERYAWFIPR